METKNFTQLAVDWKKEMSDKLSNTEISYDCNKGFKAEKYNWNPNFVMKERHKVEHLAGAHQIKFFPLPKETVFVEASKLIRKENSEMLTHAKEERMVKRAIQSLEKSFSEYRNSAKFSLIELERLNKRKENARFTEKTNTREKNKQIDSEVFYKNFKKIYKTINCEKSSINNRTEHNVYCKNLDKNEKNLKNLRDKNLKRECEVFPYGGDEMNVESDLNRAVCSESAENESDYSEHNDEQNKLYPSPKDMPSDNNSEKESESHDLEKSNTGIDSKFVHKNTLMRYWKAWRKFVMRTRNDKEKLMRLHKIDLFLTRLTKTVYSDNTAGSENRKLHTVKNTHPTSGKTSQKRRNKSASVTETDKNLDRIKDELNKSAVEAFEHLRRGLKNFHPSIRPKVKVLSALPKIDRTSYRTETRKDYPIPSFLVRMENRCKERKKRWEDIDRRKRQIQAEKEQIEREREEEKMKMEELRRKEKLEELVKKRLERKKAEEEREMRKQQIKKKIALAQEHYVTYLKKRIGFEPWKNLISIRNAQLQKADLHFQMRISKLHIKYWRNYTLMQIKEKCEKADKTYNYNLLKRSFTILINDYNETVKKLQVALDWSDAKLTEKIFKVWLRYTEKERLDTIVKEEVAISNYNRVITYKHFKKWKKFPEYVRNEKQKEIRKRLLQRKVQEFLPDYQPAYVSEF